MSERELASRCGISHSYLNQLIKGINPSTKKTISPTLSTLEKLSKGSGVSVEALQRITRGVFDNGRENQLVKDIEFNIANLHYPQKFENQIKDFQDFMQELNINRHYKTEADWTELISTVKKTIENHVETKKQAVL